MFPKVKNVNVESAKKRSKLLVFSARSFLSKNPHEWVHQGGFHFVLGTRIVSWNTNRLCLELELFTICSGINETFNETMNGH